MYVYFNNNPLGRRTAGDCSVRAISRAIGVSWDDAHDMLSKMSKNMGTIMNENDVIAAVLRMNGFYKENLPCFDDDCYTIADFANNFPIGTYVLGTGNHVVCVESGNWYDTFNSADEIPIYFFVK